MTEYSKSIAIGQSDGFIYAMRAGEFIKFGWAKNVETRRLQLQTGCPTEIEVLASVGWPRNYEKAIHAMHRESRTHGEWFEMNDATMATVRQMLANNPEEVAAFAGVVIPRSRPKVLRVSDALLNELIHKFPVCAATKVCAMIMKNAGTSSVSRLTPWEVSEAIGVDDRYARRLLKKVADSPFAERIGEHEYAINKTAMFPGFTSVVPMKPSDA